MEMPQVAQEEVVLTIRDRNGSQLVRAAVERAKSAGDLASEIADLIALPVGSYSLYESDGGERLDPTRTLDENLNGQTAADLTLIGDLTGN